MKNYFQEFWLKVFLGFVIWLVVFAASLIVRFAFPVLIWVVPLLLLFHLTGHFLNKDSDQND